MCVGAMAPRTKYWQDVILKPNQGWIESYGYRGESVLAYNARSMLVAQQAQGQRIAALEKVVFADPNGVTDPNE